MIYLHILSAKNFKVSRTSAVVMTIYRLEALINSVYSVTL